MLHSALRIAQCHSNAAKDFRPEKSVPRDAIHPDSLPPFWGAQGPLHIVTWMIGFARCVSAVDITQARAIIASTSTAMFITVASISRFSRKIGSLSYDDHTRLLFVLHIAPILVICVHNILVQRSS